MAFGSTRDKDIRSKIISLVDEPMTLCSELLIKFFADEANRQSLIQGIIEQEHKADQIVTEAYDLIDRSFITWIDKRDLTHLLDALDTIVDRMREAAQQADIYGTDPSSKESNELTAVIREMVGWLQKMVKDLEKPGLELFNVPAMELQKLEHRGDEIRYSGLRRLYPKGHNGIVMCEDRIHWILETVTDNCNHAAKVMISIARKAG